MPVIITPEPSNSPGIEPLYRIESNYSPQLILIDYTNALIIPSIDSYYNSYLEQFDYILNLHIKVQEVRPYDKEGMELKLLEDSVTTITIRTSNYTLAIYIYNQLMAGKDITPDTIKDDLPEVLL